MPMFGSPKRHVFKPTAYGTTRRQRRIPRWLVLLLTGVVLGAGGLLFLQKSYGPTRLTVEQSEQLHYDLNSTNMDKQRLQSELGRETRSLAEVRAQLQTKEAELKAAQAQVAKTDKDLQLFANAMPGDPRGTSPGIRAASFAHEGETLDYQILIMQDQGKTGLFKGTAELTVAGNYNNGKSGHIDLPPFPIELTRYIHATGSDALPAGFSARQVTI